MQTDFSRTIMELRYSWEKDGRKETWEEIAERVVDNVFSIRRVNKDIIDEVKQIIKDRKFIPGGRFLAQAGRNFHQTSNCYCLRAEDTREGWGELANKATVMLMSGGGIGVDYCLSPETLVLMETLSWKPVGDLSIGDKLIAFDETLNLQRGIVQESVVTSVGRKVLPCYEVVTDKGTVISSELHKWVSRKHRNNYKKRGQGFKWVETINLREGDEVGFCIRPWKQENDPDLFWLGGILDGEGWLTVDGKGKSCLGFAQKEGDILTKALSILDRYNIGYTSNKNKQNDVVQIQISGKWNRLKLLSLAPTVRLSKKQRFIWDGSKLGGKTNHPAKILSIQFLGNREVITLGTSTKTLIGGGFYHHNSVIRPKGSSLKRTGGQSSGPTYLAKIINEIGRGVIAGGKRRSAILASLNWSHPDVFDFIILKNWELEVRELKKKNVDFPAVMDMTNISINLDKEFFKAFENKEHALHVHAHKVYSDVINRMCKTGEPGFLVNCANPKESLRNAPICGDTYVLTKYGYKQVGDIVGIPVDVWTGKQFAGYVSFEKTKENAKIIAVSMSGGRTIRCDEDHEFFVVKSKWVSRKKVSVTEKVKAKNLKIRDNLLIQLPEIETTGKLDIINYTLGYTYGDGSFSYGHKSAEITLCTEESKKCLNNLKTKYVSSINLNDGRGYIRIHYKTDPYFYGRYKEIFPEEIYYHNADERASFIAGLWDADGNYGRNMYRLSSIYISFLDGVRRLLESLGIISYISKNGVSTYGKKQCYQLVISSSHNQKFSKLIPMVRVPRIDFSNYKSYRPVYIRVEDTKYDGYEDVYCCNVGVPEHSFMAEGVIISNCGEIVSEDDCDLCCLGSINLANIDSIEELKTVTNLAVLFLILGTEYTDVPFQKVKQVKINNRRLGLGLMGMYEWLIKRGLRYEPNKELGVWLEEWKNQSRESANKWADRFNFNEPVAVRAIAPNGSTSIAGGQTTGGIEPIFAVAYQRRYLTPEGWKKQYVVDPVAEKLVEQRIDPNTIEDAYDLSKDVERRIAFQAYIQSYVDNAISSTINLPAFGLEGNNNPEEFGKILYKYLPRLRGITVYPDSSRSGQPIQKVDFSEAIKHKGVIFEANEDTCKEGVCGL